MWQQRLLLLLLLVLFSLAHSLPNKIPVYRTNETAALEADANAVDADILTFSPYYAEVYIYLLNRTKEPTGYTLQPFRMVLDTTNYYTYLLCCSSPSAIETTQRFKTSKCFPSLLCAAEPCDEEISGQREICRSRVHPFKLYNPLYNSTHEKLLQEAEDFSYVRDYKLYRQRLDIPMDKISFDGIHGMPQGNNTNTASIQLIYTDSRYFINTDGALGLGYAPIGVSFHGYVYVHYADDTKWFALDYYNAEEQKLKTSGEDGFLLLGKDQVQQYLSDKYKTNETSQLISWSERQYRITDPMWRYYLEHPSLMEFGHRFTVYNLRVGCYNKSIPLLSNYSTHWQAEINTRIDGISMPIDFFNMVTSWINSSLAVEMWDDATVEQLPSLSFSLTFDGPSIEIPLSLLVKSLIDKHGNTRKVFHLYNVGNMAEIQGLGVVRPVPTIEIGNMVLQHMTTILDMSAVRVGFIPKGKIRIVDHKAVDTTKPSNCCKKKAVCRGGQTYYEPANTCLDPQCYYYFFQSLDDYSKTCRIRPEFFFVFAVGLMVLGIFETLIYEMYIRLSVYLQRHEQRVRQSMHSLRQ